MQYNKAREAVAPGGKVAHTEYYMEEINTAGVPWSETAQCKQG